MLLLILTRRFTKVRSREWCIGSLSGSSSFDEAISCDGMRSGGKRCHLRPGEVLQSATTTQLIDRSTCNPSRLENPFAGCMHCPTQAFREMSSVELTWRRGRRWHYLGWPVSCKSIQRFFEHLNALQPWLLVITIASHLHGYFRIGLRRAGSITQPPDVHASSYLPHGFRVGFTRA